MFWDRCMWCRNPILYESTQLNCVHHPGFDILRFSHSIQGWTPLTRRRSGKCLETRTRSLTIVKATNEVWHEQSSTIASSIHHQILEPMQTIFLAVLFFKFMDTDPWCCSVHEYTHYSKFVKQDSTWISFSKTEGAQIMVCCVLPYCEGLMLWPDVETEFMMVIRLSFKIKFLARQSCSSSNLGYLGIDFIYLLYAHLKLGKRNSNKQNGGCLWVLSYVRFHVVAVGRQFW